MYIYIKTITLNPCISFRSRSICASGAESEAPPDPHSNVVDRSYEVTNALRGASLH